LNGRWVQFDDSRHGIRSTFIRLADSAQTQNVDRGSQGFEENRNAADKKIFIRDIGAFI
jgi:hypothetical protein